MAIDESTHEYKEFKHHYYLYMGTVLKGTTIKDGVGRQMYETTIIES